MSHFQSKSLFTIALSENNWRAIQSLVQNGCQQRSERWKKWARSMVNHIDTAITSQIQPDFEHPNTAPDTSLDNIHNMHRDKYGLLVDDDGWAWSFGEGWMDPAQARMDRRLDDAENGIVWDD